MPARRNSLSPEMRKALENQCFSVRPPRFELGTLGLENLQSLKVKLRTPYSFAAARRNSHRIPDAVSVCCARERNSSRNTASPGVRQPSR